MNKRAPGNWREWVRQRQDVGWRKKTEKRERLRGRIMRYLRIGVLGGLLVLLLFRLAGTGGVVRSHLGDFDSWAFWLRESPLPVGVESASLDATGALRLAVVNRPSASDAAVLVDGSEAGRFHQWYIRIRVKPGQTLTLMLDDGAEPVRIRVISQQGVRFPRLGQEWSVVSGRQIVGTVALATGHDD